MADIFNEIDEELRGDQMRRIWAKFSGLILAVAILIVVGVAGWRGWQYWSEQTARADGDKYLAAIQLSAKGDYKGAEAALESLARTGNTGYALISRFRAAGERNLAGDGAGAMAAFDALSHDPSVPALYQGLATIRAAYIALDLEDRTSLDKRLGTLAASTGPWRHQAREILAVAALKADDIADAQKRLEQIQADPETPSDMSRRMDVIAAVISSATKKDLPAAPAAPAATVPAPAPAAPSPEPTLAVPAPAVADPAAALPAPVIPPVDAPSAAALRAGPAAGQTEPTAPTPDSPAAPPAAKAE